MMRFPIGALQSILRPRTARRGIVTRIVGSRAEVATDRGLIIATGDGVSVGSRVIIEGGIARIASTPSARYSL
jgi:hypothetical protein